MTVESKCQCQHDVELHELDEIHWDRSEEDHLILKWRFKCKGWYGTAFNPMPCSCTNFQPREVAEKEEP